MSETITYYSAPNNFVMRHSISTSHIDDVSNDNETVTMRDTYFDEYYEERECERTFYRSFEKVKGGLIHSLKTQIARIQDDVRRVEEQTEENS